MDPGRVGRYQLYAVMTDLLYKYSYSPDVHVVRLIGPVRSLSGIEVVSQVTAPSCAQT